MKVRFNNAIFWIGSEADFIRIKEGSIDSESWPSTYSKWVQNVENGIAEGIKRGLVFSKIDADPDSFFDWCKVKSHVADTRARSLYAAEQLGNRGRENN